MATERKTSKWAWIAIIISIPIILWRLGTTGMFGPEANLSLPTPIVSREDGRVNQGKDDRDQGKAQLSSVEALRVWEERFYAAGQPNLVAEFLGVVETLIAKAGLEVTEKQLLDGLRAPEGWVKVGINLSGQGDFFTVAAFLNQVYGYEKFIAVERVRISADQSRKILNYDLTLTTLALKK